MSTPLSGSMGAGAVWWSRLLARMPEIADHTEWMMSEKGLRDALQSSREMSARLEEILGRRGDAG